MPKTTVLVLDIMKIQKIFSEVETGEKLYSVLMSEEEYKIKRFSLLGLSILDFQELVQNIKFPNKSKDLIDNIVDWNSTYEVIDSLGYSQSKKVKSLLSNDLEPEVKKVLDGNSNFGSNPSPRDFELYVIYLEKVNNKPVLSFGLEAKKNIGNLKKGNCFSFSIQL